MLTVKLWGQLKQLSSLEEIKLNSKDSYALVAELAQKHPELKNLLLSNDAPHPSLLLFRNGQHLQWNETVELDDNDDLTLMTPMAGG